MTNLGRRFYAALVVPFDRTGKIDQGAYEEIATLSKLLSAAQIPVLQPARS